MSEQQVQHPFEAPNPAKPILDRIEKISRDLCLFYVFEQWEIYLFNGWLNYPIQPIPLSSPHAPEAEISEKGQDLFWTKNNGYLYPFFADLVIALLHKKDSEENPNYAELPY